jgi:hypothetical protein
MRRNFQTLIVAIVFPYRVCSSGQPSEFDAFLQSVVVASYDQSSNSLVRDSEAFEEMRGHIIRMYEGVTVTGSVVESDAYGGTNTTGSFAQNNIFDCIAIESQPTVKAFNIDRVASPPPANTSDISLNSTIEIPIGVGASCDPGSIPMKRLSLERLTQFRTLHHFFSKHGNHVTNSESYVSGATAHKYAVYGASGPNYGGGSVLSFQDPPAGYRFSLSQQWYSSGNPVQTAECGIVHQSAPSTVFLYRTNAGYAAGSGCYNLDCAGFVQTDRSVALGGSISPYGNEVSYSFRLYQGNWWFYFAGKPIGYYPGQSVYRGGAMNYHADVIEFGGETLGDPYPPMGTGQWGTSGSGRAAYQRNMYYYDQQGAAHAPSLRQIEVDTSCYNAMVQNGHIFFGGPGGYNCHGAVVV